MKFGISRVWKTVFEVKEFNTLEEMLGWVRSQNHDIIIQYVGDDDHEYDWELEIYDDYRE